MNRVRLNNSTQRCGASATEFALILPLVLLLAFAGADFGRSIHAYIALSNAARSGAEFASRNPYSPRDITGWESRIRGVVAEELSGTGGIDPTQLEIEVVVDPITDGIYDVTVEASYAHPSLVTWPGLPTSDQLHQSVTMRRQR